MRETLPSDFQARRVEFADRLRGFRERTGLSGKELAARLGWGNSKVSKIETGKQTPTDTEVASWLAALDVPSDTAERHRAELRELRAQQVTWRRQLREGHRGRQDTDAASEREATLIRAVDIAAVPGLLQTPDYARAVFTSQGRLLDVPDDVDAAVTARMERQRVLYEPGRTVDILVAEAALRHPVATRQVMAAQVDRLVSAVGLPGVRFGVLPLGRPLPYVPWHGYWIVDGRVYVELVTSEVLVDDPDQVALYHRLTDALWTVAVEGDAARTLLAGIVADLPR